MKLIKYKLKQRTVTEPEIELPKGSQVVSVKHHDEYQIEEMGCSIPECWQVIWLEPIKK